MEQEKKTQEVNEDKDSIIQPDPETLHKTDPQDNMKGPVSSLANAASEAVEDITKPEPQAEDELNEED